MKHKLKTLGTYMFESLQQVNENNTYSSTNVRTAEKMRNIICMLDKALYSHKWLDKLKGNLGHATKQPNILEAALTLKLLQADDGLEKHIHASIVDVINAIDANLLSIYSAILANFTSAQLYRDLQSNEGKAKYGLEKLDEWNRGWRYEEFDMHNGRQIHSSRYCERLAYILHRDPYLASNFAKITGINIPIEYPDFR